MLHLTIGCIVRGKLGGAAIDLFGESLAIGKQHSEDVGECELRRGTRPSKNGAVTKAWLEVTARNGKMKKGGAWGG